MVSWGQQASSSRRQRRRRQLCPPLKGSLQRLLPLAASRMLHGGAQLVCRVHPSFSLLPSVADGSLAANRRCTRARRACSDMAVAIRGDWCGERSGNRGLVSAAGAAFSCHPSGEAHTLCCLVFDQFT